MPSLEQSSLQPLFVKDSGKSVLPNVDLGNGSFLLRPLVIGDPGLSTAFTEVPIGPGCLFTTSLISLARLESLVAQMDMVAVAPTP